MGSASHFRSCVCVQCYFYDTLYGDTRTNGYGSGVRILIHRCCTISVRNQLIKFAHEIMIKFLAANTVGKPAKSVLLKQTQNGIALCCAAAAHHAHTLTYTYACTYLIRSFRCQHWSSHGSGGDGVVVDKGSAMHNTVAALLWW